MEYATQNGKEKKLLLLQDMNTFPGANFVQGLLAELPGGGRLLTGACSRLPSVYAVHYKVYKRENYPLNSQVEDCSTQNIKHNL